MSNEKHYSSTAEGQEPTELTKENLDKVLDLLVKAAPAINLARCIELMKHTTGLNRGETVTRNYFISDAHGQDFEDLEYLRRNELVDRKPAGICQGFRYWVTEKGFKFLGVDRVK